MTDTPDDEHELLSVPAYDDATFRWTARKEKFCYHFARMGHIQKAETAAGYAGTNHGTYLLLQKEIRDRVQKEVRNLLRADGENEDSVIARWANWADVDIGDYFDPGWVLKDIADLSADARRCIKKVKITMNQWGRNTDFELHDAAAANVHLANMMGILSNDDGPGLTADEQAKSIKQMLQEMNDVNGLEEPTLEGSAGRGSQTTH